jgi:hypothetical protein
VLVVGEDALDGVGLEWLPVLVGGLHAICLLTAVRDRSVEADLRLVGGALRVHAYLGPAQPVREQAGDGGLADADRPYDHDRRDGQCV